MEVRGRCDLLDGGVLVLQLMTIPGQPDAKAIVTHIPVIVAVACIVAMIISLSFPIACAVLLVEAFVLESVSRAGKPAK